MTATAYMCFSVSVCSATLAWQTNPSVSLLLVIRPERRPAPHAIDATHARALKVLLQPRGSDSGNLRIKIIGSEMCSCTTIGLVR